ncbi:hypothetical protein BX600DRAFT_190897 [Xylariales sp. PMI_506]|nr:hypothetical protein BX600DRAFT_190897 [Xylariales sp. PMI_506]
MVSFFNTQPQRHHSRQPHHDSHNHQSTHYGERPLRREVELVDLDDIRDNVTISIKSTTRLSKVAEFLRRRDMGVQKPIYHDAEIRFYLLDIRLLGDEIPQSLTTLRYRALHPGDGGDAIQVCHSDDVPLSQAQVDEISGSIDKEVTIGVLRSIVASHIELDDPNRVIISACGGLRPGLLTGNSWDVYKIKTWLCREIYIDLAPPRAYIILRGANQEFIYHPPAGYKEESISVRNLRRWCRRRLVAKVHHSSMSRHAVDDDDDDVAIILGGSVLTKRRRVPFGRAVDFELPRSVEERFLQEQGWLVTATESCVVCGDDKKVFEMPRQVTRACEHKPSTCRECAGQWIASSLETQSWDRLRCPECPQLLQFQDVRNLASQEVFNRYDELAVKAFIGSIHDFRWCLNPVCGAGQIVRGDCSKVRCLHCRAASCAHHNLPWHSGETCEQYDKRTRHQRKSEKASEKKVKEITKPCPHCRRNVNKYSGCDHITCVCGHEWCYLCLEPYYRDRNSFLQCNHKRDCKYFENPPNYEGGRAFMPFINAANFERFGGIAPPPPRHLGGAHMRGDVDQPGRPRHDIIPDGAIPFQFMLENLHILAQRGQDRAFRANRVRPEHHNEFVGAAALFTMEQLMQRAR